MVELNCDNNGCTMMFKKRKSKSRTKKKKRNKILSHIKKYNSCEIIFKILKVIRNLFL